MGGFSKLHFQLGRSYVSSVYYRDYGWRVLKTHTSTNLIGTKGLEKKDFGHLSSQSPTYRETYLAVNFHVSLVTHQWPFCQAKCLNWAILSHFKINQHLLWWSFIHSSFASHLHLSLYPFPLFALAPKKCMVGNIMRARLSTPGLSGPICSHLVWNVRLGPGLSRSEPGNWCCLFICFLCLLSLLTQRPLFG